MSRLADILSRMDRPGARPGAVGGIPGLGRPERSPRRWRRVPYLVMLAAMAALPAALLVRSQSSAPPAKPVVAPVRPPEATPRPVPAATALGLTRRGLEAAQSGAAGEAASLFRQAVELNPTDAETWNNLGVVLARQGEVSDASDAFRRALALRPAHAEAHRNFAVVLDRRGRTSEAIMHYRAFLANAGASSPDREGAERRLAELSRVRP